MVNAVVGTNNNCNDDKIGIGINIKDEKSVRCT